MELSRESFEKDETGGKRGEGELMLQHGASNRGGREVEYSGNHRERRQSESGRAVSLRK